MKTLAGPIRLELAQFRELESFAQFGSDLTKDTLERLDQGRRIVEILKQPQNAPLPVEEQVLLFYAVTNRHFSDISPADIQATEADFTRFMREMHNDIYTRVREEKQISKELGEAIEKAIQAFKATKRS